MSSEFTWKGPREGVDHIKARLDRGLATALFSQIFPTCTVQNTSVSHSNHLALVLCLQQASSAQSSRVKRVRCFEPHWTKDEDFMEFFEKLWFLDNHPFIDVIHSNLGSILYYLEDWNKKKFGNIFSHTKTEVPKLDMLRT